MTAFLTTCKTMAKRTKIVYSIRQTRIAENAHTFLMKIAHLIGSLK